MFTLLKLLVFAAIASALVISLIYTTKDGVFVAIILGLPWDIIIFFSDSSRELFEITGFGYLLKQSGGWGNVGYPLILGIGVGSFINAFIFFSWIHWLRTPDSQKNSREQIESLSKTESGIDPQNEEKPKP
jgi:hypothetical protein